MANIVKYKSKIKVYEDFKKIIQIEKIKFSKKINEFKQYVTNLTFFVDSIEKLKNFMENKINLLEYYSTKGKKFFPKNVSSAYFILETKFTNKISNYSNKKIKDFIIKKVKPYDKVYIIGNKLYNYLLSDKKLDSYNIILFREKIKNYINLSIQIIDFSWTLYNNIECFNIHIIYDDIKTPKNLFNKVILPLEFTKNKKTHKVNDTNNKKKMDFAQEIQKITQNALKTYNVKYSSDITNVAISVLKNFISSNIQNIFLNYMLNIYLREFQMLEEKDQTIDDNVLLLKKEIQKVRKEKITRELLTNLTAFKVVNSTKEDEDF